MGRVCWCAVGALLLVGCGGAGEPVELRSGEYDLALIPEPGFNLGERLELAADGSFAGHGWAAIRRDGEILVCRGMVAEGGMDALTAALADARVLGLEPDPEERCGIDSVVFDLTVDVVHGPHAGEHNAFRFDSACHPELEPVREAARAMVGAVYADGCDGEWVAWP